MNLNPDSAPLSSLSFCMIVKNEAQNLSRCLASVQNYVDEIVVVDTGSEDSTIAIAEQYGAKIRHFQWCDDFAAARNFAIAQVSGDWILTLDADEELQVDVENWRSQLTSDRHFLAYWLNLFDLNQPMTPLRIPRIFRKLPGLRYEGRYHEHLKFQQQALDPAKLGNLTGVKILHYGYEDNRLLEKNLTRDIPLLERIRQQENLNLLLLLTLADAYLRTNQIEKARECWAEAFDRLLPNLFSGTLPAETARLPATLFTLGSDLLLNQEDYETTLLICRRGLEWFPDYPPLNHLTGRLFQAMGFLLAAAPYFDKCLQMGREETYFRREPFDLEFMRLWPAYDLAIVQMSLGQFQAAANSFQLALTFQPDYEPAQQGLMEAQRQMAFA